jgi:hypothetical protein
LMGAQASPKCAAHSGDAGPRGWLGFFIFSSYVLVPLVGLWTLGNGFKTTEHGNPQVMGGFGLGGL